MNLFVACSRRLRRRARAWIRGGLSLAAAGLLLPPALPAAAPASENPRSILGTKHNLSVSGSGDVHAATETEICIFCHAPHGTTGETPLWNHQLPATPYIPYNSPTLKATVGQPTGSSKLCLSCHDGTVAVGMVASRRQPIAMRNGSGLMPAGASRLGTDLSGHHPVSFTYDAALASVQGELRDPLTLKREVRLDQNQQVQCTSCHDPHSDLYGKFLVKDNTSSAICVDCHTPRQWLTSAHATSQATWKGNGRNPWPKSTRPTVAANGCENCHSPHEAGSKPQLLNLAKAEDNCLICHNGAVAAKNIAAEFSKPSAHPLTSAIPRHDAAQNPMAGSRQVGCVDCHDPHAARSGAKTGAGGVSGALAQVRGISAAGTLLNAVTQEHELCFRCHADTASPGAAGVPRQFSQANTRLQFSPGNASYHPVLAVVKSAPSSSLVSPWTSASRLGCGDCHNNNRGPGSGGSGPSGPHGSDFPKLLERQQVLSDYSPETQNTYALCYKCHSRSAILSDQGFKEHRRHVVEQQTACTTCHDPHGVATAKHLINFNTIYVKASATNRRLEYVSTGPGRGNCSLTCHGKDHDAAAYPKSSVQPAAAAASRRGR